LGIFEERQMPKLTVINIVGSDVRFQDRHGSGFAFDVPAGQTKVVTITDDQLRSMEPQLNAEQTASKITWSSAPDPTDPADAGSIGSHYASAVRAATGALETIAHGLGVVPKLVIVAPVVSPGSYAALSVVEGSHDATNLKVTVATGWSYRIYAFI
jgi:hypothetical protein